MRVLRSLVIVGASLVAIAACGDPSSPTSDTSPPATTPGTSGPPDGSGRDQLAVARERWEAARITDYELTTAVGCFCPELPSIRVRVTDGVVVSVTELGTTDIDLGEPRTVESWFEEIERLLDGGADRVDVTYDAATGRPLSMWVDREEQAVDEEYSVETVAFAAGADIPAVVDLESFDPATLTETWPCGYGFRLSNPEQTVAVSIEYTGTEPLTAGAAAIATDLPDPSWDVEMWVGRDLLANWCDDVVEVGEPTAVRDQTWTAVAGTIGSLVVPDGTGEASIRIDGLVVAAPDGSRFELGDVAARNPQWGLFAG